MIIYLDNDAVDLDIVSLSVKQPTNVDTFVSISGKRYHMLPDYPEDSVLSIKAINIMLPALDLLQRYYYTGRACLLRIDSIGLERSMKLTDFDLDFIKIIPGVSEITNANINFQSVNVYDAY